MGASRIKPGAVCSYGNAAMVVIIAVYLLIIPGLIVAYDLRDPALQGEGIPRCAFRWHRALSPKYERWARARIAAGAGAELAVHDISGTEWPLFGSVFYLWATESLQEAWERDHSLSPIAPREYARGAVEAAAALVADPDHATWVKTHWGEDYLHTENVFYRMLLISALTSRIKLLGGEKHKELLRDQVETLSRALDESPYGLLDDYPGQCYPTDVLGAVGAIKRADSVLGTDHSAFVQRAKRAFEGELLDITGLPPYAADPDFGEAIGPARGCGNSFMMLVAPELWPETAREWYSDYEKHFWQHRWTAVGFREFPKDMPNRNWYMDVDAGPVVAGHGFAACAFGVGAARANGRFDHAYPLSAEMLVMCWPLPHGTLAAPRILSNAAHAPYLGESAVIFNLTRQPVGNVSVRKGGRLPGFVYIVLCAYFAVGGLLIGAALLRLRRRVRRLTKETLPAGRLQLAMWAMLVFAGLVVCFALSAAVGLLILLCAEVLPRGWRKIGSGDGEPSPQPLAPEAETRHNRPL